MSTSTSSSRAPLRGGRRRDRTAFRRRAPGLRSRTHTIVRAPAIATLAVACILASASAEVPVHSFEQALLLARQGPEVQLAQRQWQLAQRQRDFAAGIVTAELRTGYGQTWSSGGEPGTETAGSGRGSLRPVTLAATLNVLPFGPAAEDVLRAEWQLEGAALDLIATEAEASVAAAEHYLATLRSRQETALREAQVALAELRLEAVRTRFEVGAANESQLLDAGLDSSIAHDELASAMGRQAGALASLSFTLGMEVLAVADEPPPAALPTAFAADERLGETASVLAAEIRVREAELAYQARLRNVLPSGAVSVGITTSSGAQSLQFGASLDTRTFQPGVSLAYDPTHAALPSGGSTTSASIGLSVRIPLDTSMPAGLDAARLQVEQSRLRLAQARDLAALEAGSRRRHLEAALAGEALSREVLEARRASLRTTTQRVALGIATELDARGAELAVQSAELALLRNQDATLLALMRLVQSRGLDPTEVF
jgi:outer membrane protein TolC